MPLSLPVTMAALFSSDMRSLLGGDWSAGAGDRRWTRRDPMRRAGAREGAETEPCGDDGTEPEDRSKAQVEPVHQRPDPEGSDAVADLVGGDDAAGRECLDRGQLLLSEPDRQGEQRRAAEPGDP